MPNESTIKYEFPLPDGWYYPKTGTIQVGDVRFYGEPIASCDAVGDGWIGKPVTENDAHFVGKIIRQLDPETQRRADAATRTRTIAAISEAIAQNQGTATDWNPLATAIYDGQIAHVSATPIPEEAPLFTP